MKDTILLSECAYHLRNLILHMCHTTRKLRGKPREGQEKVEEVPFISLIATQREIKPSASKYLCQVEPLLQLVRRHFEQRLVEGSTGPTPAQHLLWLPSLEHLSTRGPPLPGPRPLLLPGGWNSSPSRCLSRCCWPSTLRRGPVARRLTMQSTEPHVAPFKAIIMSEIVRRSSKKGPREGELSGRNSCSISLRSSGEGPGKVRFCLNN